MQKLWSSAEATRTNTVWLSNQVAITMDGFESSTASVASKTNPWILVSEKCQIGRCHVLASCSSMVSSKVEAICPHNASSPHAMEKAFSSPPFLDVGHTMRSCAASKPNRLMDANSPVPIKQVPATSSKRLRSCTS